MNIVLIGRPLTSTKKLEDRAYTPSSNAVLGKNFNSLSLLTFSILILQSLSAQKTFILITSLYNEKDTERASEYITCLLHNVHNRYIKKIHVIYDTTHDTENNLMKQFIQQKKVILTLHKGRPSFQFIFNLANEKYPNENIIISNADIYFNETLAKLENVNLENKFLALTRWDLKPDGYLRPYILADGSPAHFSQDSWIFQTPIAIKDAHVQMGTFHCEHLLNKEVENAGLQLLNPCLSIICCHLHNSHKRNYTTFPLPIKPYALPWCYLASAH